jgi:hypothetical protein
MLVVFDMLDRGIAQELGVPVEEYIEVIESCSYWEAYYIVTAIWNERTDKYDRAKEIYNTNKEKFLKKIIE